MEDMLLQLGKHTLSPPLHNSYTAFCTNMQQQ